MAGRTQQPMQQPGPSPAPNKARRKRNQPPVYSGIGSSYEDKDNDFVCAVCFEMIEEAHMTKCGHSFCFKCIKRQLEVSNRCPKCNYVIEKHDQIFPNFNLNELILKHQRRQAEKKARLENQTGGLTLNLDDIVTTPENLDLADINLMLDVLSQKKQQLEADCKAVQHQLLKEFLVQVRRKKRQQLDELSRDLRLLDEDCIKVDVNSSCQLWWSWLPKCCLQNQKIAQDVTTKGFISIKGRKCHDPYFEEFPEQWEKLAEFKKTLPTSGETSPVNAVNVMNGFDPAIATGSAEPAQEGFNGSKSVSKHRWPHTSLSARRKKVYQHFDDLEQCYFSIRQKEFTTDDAGVDDGLEEFTDSLSKFVRFNTFRPLATLSYASDIYNGSSIVSSIDFDRDCEFFAIAGVTKKIKVFEYGTVIRDAVDIHYPITEMVCNSKISCIAWNSYHKGILASSDYEGTITIWDALTGAKSRLLQEHEKRCWSVDFNRVDPKLLASGSDDSKVKLWSTNTEHSVACIEAKANVCCVKFNPESRYYLAFGSADHCVHYYDLRSTQQPVVVFKGHRKAVSYAKFVNSQELVSASTDSQLKLWSLTNKPHCLRTFRGHVNEKNFVGLASDGDYIACGSENNSLCVYYKGLSKQLLNFKFDTVRSVLEKEKKEEDANEFVSAVCWRPGSNVVVAANSQGIIKVLELV